MLGPKIYKTSYDLSANITFPKMIRTHLEQGIASCATGYDRTALKRSLGEALERHVAFSDTDTDILFQNLSEMHPVIRKWFLKNSIPGRVREAENHPFTMIKVTELATGCPYFAPQVAFKLGQNPDDEFFGSRDSSGSALHQSATQAQQGSCDEFCERQALSLFWYFGHCNACLDLKGSETLDKLKGRLRFLPSMMITGRILLFDISLFRPVRTVLTVYLSDSGPVRFAAGASGCQEMDIAVEKSLFEMYQAYVLMANVTDPRTQDIVEIQDEIIAGYTWHNCQHTVDKFLDIFNNNDMHLTTFPSTVDFIKDFSNEPILAYREKICFPDKSIHLCVMKSVNGFKKMSLDDQHAEENMAAARHYGYTTLLNTGPIPFA